MNAEAGEEPTASDAARPTAGFMGCVFMLILEPAVCNNLGAFALDLRAKSELQIDERLRWKQFSFYVSRTRTCQCRRVLR